MLAAVQQLAEAGALKKWGVVETPPRRNVLQGKPVIVHLPFAAALISVAELGTPTRSNKSTAAPPPNRNRRAAHGGHFSAGEDCHHLSAQ